MAAQGVRWVRWVLLALAAVVPVGAAVAANQILTDAGWKWWWSVPAVALAAAGLWVTDRLTRKPSAVPGARPLPSAQKVTGSTAGGSINQVSGVRGSVHLGAPAVPVPPTTSAIAPSGPATPHPPGAGQGEDDDDEGAGAAPGGGQHVGGSHASGSITQITGVGGDVNIERS
ncbi:hypothetical protein ACIBG7_27040 [Nonomuraea sp. NPDC050328]|uniref:hypothetical protein n=1 Tax=Nonomuraea sp. NPDC050328 TaxID=3364361 RepID=UPI0037990C2A